MMKNPYRPAEADLKALPSRLPVKRYVLVSTLLCLAATGCAIPGIYLLNQEYGWVPTRSGISGIEINGVAVSNGTVIRYSIGISIAGFVVALLVLAKCARNLQSNHHVTAGSEKRLTA